MKLLDSAIFSPSAYFLFYSHFISVKNSNVVVFPQFSFKKLETLAVFHQTQQAPDRFSSVQIHRDF